MSRSLTDLPDLVRLRIETGRERLRRREKEARAERDRLRGELRAAALADVPEDMVEYLEVEVPRTGLHGYASLCVPGLAEVRAVYYQHGNTYTRSYWGAEPSPVKGWATVRGWDQKKWSYHPDLDAALADAWEWANWQEACRAARPLTWRQRLRRWWAGRGWAWRLPGE